MSTTPNSMADARARVERLVEHFHTNLDSYKNSAYNETQTRREFIDPFFKALGWDVDNEAGYAPAYKDVIHEDAIKIGGFTKAPDYCFRIGGQRKFFVEAKKPFVDMKHDPVPYYQLRRYGFSAKLPLSIVTDFEELAIVDCRAKPSPNDKASTGRIRYWRYDEYLEHFEEIYNTFSKEAVLTGSFDRSIASAKTKRGTGEVDKEFLKEIESWRDELARNIARRNPGLTQRQLNEAVQVTIDRIIFLRICEDRGIEEYGVLQGMQNGANVYGRLCQLFQRADERYNSGLFHFKDEKNRPGHPDDLTLNLTIGDKTLKQILKGLYYPDSPYEFSVLPADILGQVYEQFLGKVIRLTAGHQAKVEDKPEVKKAGGVYYTPTYIVDYIVKNTVGKLLAGSTPKKAAKLRILDPACGSGSFLIGAYEYLLDWHRDWYTENDAEKWAQGREPRLFMGKAGWQLTTAEKKRILLNNIHGVDIDPQAVEVTKLSLLLKVLEEENQESINAQLKFFRERALPDLSRNIKCGNSLIGTDFYEGQQMGLLDEEEQMRINVFDWDGSGGFPEIMKGGGFDAVIGNPPYVRQESISHLKLYFKDHFKSFQSTADLYSYFIERGLNLLKLDGLFSMILSSGYLRAGFAEALRRHVRESRAILEFIDFGGLPVFENAKDTYVSIPLFARRAQPRNVSICKVETFNNLDLSVCVARDNYTIPITRFVEAAWSLDSEAKTSAFNKIKSCGLPLGEYVNHAVYYGIKTGLNKAFELSEEEKNQMVREQPHCEQLIKHFLGGKDIRRYKINDSNRHLILIPSGWTIRQMGSANTEKAAWNWLNEHYAPIAERISSFEQNARKRQDKGQYWWELRSCDYYGVLDAPKIIYPDIAKHPRFFLDDTGTYITNTAYCLGTDDLFLLGILNSKLSWFCVGSISIPFGTRAGEFRYRLFDQYMEKIPIRRINFSDPTDKSRHDQMVELVERMLDLNKRLQAAKTAHEKDTLQRQIDATDRQIDRLVYELYGLTEDEINIVEAGTSK